MSQAWGRSTNPPKSALLAASAYSAARRTGDAASAFRLRLPTRRSAGLSHPAATCSAPQSGESCRETQGFDRRNAKAPEVSRRGLMDFGRTCPAVNSQNTPYLGLVKSFLLPLVDATLNQPPGHLKPPRRYGFIQSPREPEYRVQVDVIDRCPLYRG